MQLSYKVWGKVHGGNLSAKAYFDGKLGAEDKEPWYYIPEKDIWWSAFDVDFIPNNQQEFEKAYKEACKTK